MKITKGSISMCFGMLIIHSTMFAQILTNKPVFEANSIKVVTNDKFPQDLESEIFIGPNELPYFRAEGTKNKLKSAEIDLGGGCPTVTVFPKENETNSYVLYLFTTDSDGKILALFDLNLDGVWDVKGTPTREQNYSIFLENHWIPVTKIEGLKTHNPRAEAKGVRYEFHEGWKIVK